jgi:hypothetical protein
MVAVQQRFRYGFLVDDFRIVVYVRVMLEVWLINENYSTPSKRVWVLRMVGFPIVKI